MSTTALQAVLAFLVFGFDAELQKKRESDARWAAANPEKVRERYARWAAANPEKVREGWARWAAANPEKVRERRARWKAANPEKVREQAMRRIKSARDWNETLTCVGLLQAGAMIENQKTNE